VEEADNLSGTSAIEPLRELVQEGRKFGVHIVLVSQKPKAFQYTEKDIRQETSFILFNRRYDQQNGIGRLFDVDATNLERGQCVFADFVDLPEMVVETRELVTRLWEEEPDRSEVEEVDRTLSRSGEVEYPSFGQESAQAGERERTDPDSGLGDLDFDLSEDEQRVVEACREYRRREGEKPSKGKLSDEAGMGRGKASEHIEELVEQGVLAREYVDKYGGMHRYQVTG
jgi:hypothetical protein